MLRGPLALVTALAGCSLPSATFECGTWEDCGPGGACEPGTSSCSFADASCISGRRFSALSAAPFTDACVELKESAGPGELCQSSSTCARLRDCLGNRCVSVSELSADGGFACGRCAVNVGGAGAPLACWGRTSLLPPFEPVILGVNAYACPSAPCPAECDEAISQPPFPQHCFGANAALAHSVGRDHLCYFNGRTQCAGSNANRQLGTDRDVLINEVPMKFYNLLAAGPRHTCGRENLSNAVACWGNDEQGQVSGTPRAGAFPDPSLTVPFPPVNGTVVAVDFIAASDRFTCAASNQNVSCWGDVPWGAGMVAGLGPGQIIDLDVGAAHACVVKGGHALCWGDNGAGQAQPVAGPGIVAPADALPGTSVVRVVTGRAHTCAIDAAGAVWCWGADDLGQLDLLGQRLGAGPVRVIADPPAVGPIAAGADFTCRLGGDDRVRCWGDVLELAGTRFTDFPLCN